MNNQKSARMPFGKAMAYSRRGFLIWWRAEPGMFISALVGEAVPALAPYLPLYFTARLVDAIAGGGDAERVWRMLAAMLIFTAVMGALQAAAVCWNSTLDASLSFSLRRIFIEKMLTMDFCDVDDPKTQELLSRIEQTDSWNGGGLRELYSSFRKAVKAVFRIIGAVALSVSLFTLPVPKGSALAWMNHPLCFVGMAVLMALSVAGVSALANGANSYWSRYDGTAGNRLFSFLFCSAIDETHRGTDIRIYSQDNYFENRGKEETNTGSASCFGPRSPIGRAARGPMGGMAAGSAAVSRAFTGVIYLFAGLKALGGAFQAGAITQYVGALTGLANGITELLETVGYLRVNAKFLEPVYQFLDIPNSMYQGSLTTEKRSDRNYELEFRDVSFKYPGTDTWALRHVSMKFSVGKRLAVVGENGSGKTTFIKLLCRLYDPTEGEILLNGIDIRKYRYDDYLALFSVVFQDFRLLAQPLGANVAAAETYDRDRAALCLEKAGFGERLYKLPRGLDTCLYRDFEDDGVEISGGEAQKIALARVLYRDAPFIVLDEPTAALDPEAEAEVYSRFNEIIGDKTAIYISHRLSSCRFCDEIAVFDGGRVVQQGEHDRLVERPGKYQTLWEAQAQYYRKKQE